jgi:hypothetical protein
LKNKLGLTKITDMTKTERKFTAEDRLAILQERTCHEYAGEPRYSGRGQTTLPLQIPFQ